jgi:hypothetical protein
MEEGGLNIYKLKNRGGEDIREIAIGKITSAHALKCHSLMMEYPIIFYKKIVVFMLCKFP